MIRIKPRATRTDTPVPYTTRFRTKRLNSPNDVVVKSDGSVWFTDPPFGLLGNYEGNRADSEAGQAVYRIDGATGELGLVADDVLGRSEEHTSELQSLMRISYAVFCLKQTP